MEEILHQLIGGSKHPIIGFQPNKVVQDFATTVSCPDMPKTDVRCEDWPPLNGVPQFSPWKPLGLIFCLWFLSSTLWMADPLAVDGKSICHSLLAKSQIPFNHQTFSQIQVCACQIQSVDVKTTNFVAKIKSFLNGPPVNLPSCTN